MLAKTVYDYTNETAWDGPDLAEDETVEVIELAPVLDLIARVNECVDPPIDGLQDDISDIVVPFLRAHGRLT
jgi:hypothetical protein